MVAQKKAVPKKKLVKSRKVGMMTLATFKKAADDLLWIVNDQFNSANKRVSAEAIDNAASLVQILGQLNQSKKAHFFVDTAQKAKLVAQELPRFVKDPDQRAVLKAVLVTCENVVETGENGLVRFTISKPLS